MLFTPGERPLADDLKRLAERASCLAGKVHIGPCSEPAEGEAELLVRGLAFDLAGLTPASSAEIPHPAHVFGISADRPASGYEALVLSTGRHLRTQRIAMPAMQALAGLAAWLARELPVQAVCWHPIGSWMEPAYFVRIAEGWLTSGAFPALGLTALRKGVGGCIESVGLGFFVGQAIQVESKVGETPAETMKLAVQVIDYMLREGGLGASQALPVPSGETVFAELSHDGRHARILRGA